MAFISRYTTKYDNARSQQYVSASLLKVVSALPEPQEVFVKRMLLFPMFTAVGICDGSSRQC